ncbi:MAG: alanine or glycine:cation symporter, family [Candidatus Dependentiae bacterium]|nr:alanine or glycine:cation symporter, family [Candidatus Dependentiae bacterium]
MIALQETIMLMSVLLLLLGSILISFKTRFIQFRAIPHMFTLLRQSFSSTEQSAYTVKAHKALFSAMATTIGISNITGPLIAIHYGGPGALFGYFLATIFGSAATFAEVTFALKFKDPAPEKDRIGGPMHYLKKVYPAFVPMLYSFFGAVLIVIWSGSQSNRLASIMSPYNIPNWLCGGLLSLFTLFVVIGGIKRVSTVAEKLVPFMFLLYAGTMIWILGCNISSIPGVIGLVLSSALYPKALGIGAALGSAMQALRWGLSKAFMCNESGIGTSTIPHSMADTENPVDQGILSIVSVYSNGLLCLLSGLVVLVTNAHLAYDNDSLGAITKIFAHYFPFVGPSILIFSATLFVITTVIGNSYNGSQFYAYLFGKKGLYIYYAINAISIFSFACMSVDFTTHIEDYLMVPVIVPHIIGIVILTFRYHSLITLKHSSQHCGGQP